MSEPARPFSYSITPTPAGVILRYRRIEGEIERVLPVTSLELDLLAAYHERQRDAEILAEEARETYVSAQVGLTDLSTSEGVLASVAAAWDSGRAYGKGEASGG